MDSEINNLDLYTWQSLSTVKKISLLNNLIFRVMFYIVNFIKSGISMRLGVLEFSEENNSLLYQVYHRVRNGWHCEEGSISTLTEETDVICLSVYTQHTVVYNVVIPPHLNKQTVKEVLWNELVARLPVEPEKIYRYYRKCDDTHYAICATERDEVDALLNIAESRALKFDTLIPRALASTPDEILQVIAGEAIPERFRPIRCRKLKTLYWLLLLPAVVLLFFNVFIRYMNFSEEYNRLRQIRREWMQEQRKEQQKFAKLSTDAELLSQLRSLKLDTPPISPILSQLTSSLPQTIWVTSYTQNYDTVDLMLSSSRDEPGLYNQIGNNAYYGIVNLRKSRGYNNTTSFFVKLKIKHE